MERTLQKHDGLFSISCKKIPASKNKNTQHDFETSNTFTVTQNSEIKHFQRLQYLPCVREEVIITLAIIIQVRRLIRTGGELASRRISRRRRSETRERLGRAVRREGRGHDDLSPGFRSRIRRAWIWPSRLPGARDPEI